MKKLLGYGILVVVSIVIFMLFIKVAGIPNGKKDASEQHATRYPPPLRRDLFTEQYLEKNIVYGMSIREVESILGKPYRSSDFMGTFQTSYLLERAKEKGLNLSGFTVIYEDGKMVEIAKMWNSN